MRQRVSNRRAPEGAVGSAPPANQFGRMNSTESSGIHWAAKTLAMTLALVAVCLLIPWTLVAHEREAKKPAPKQAATQPAPASTGQSVASPSTSMPAGDVHGEQKMDAQQIPHATEAESAPHTHPAEEAVPGQPEAAGATHMNHEGMDMEGMDMGDAAGENAEAAHEHGAHAHGGGTPSAPLVLTLLLITLAVAVGMTLVARYWLRHSPAPSAEGPAPNLLDKPIIGKVLRSRWFLTLLIAPTLLIFTFIVVAGLVGEQNTGNPSVLLTWILWWPAVIFTFFILGRIWCAICPFGFLGDMAQKFYSLKLKVPSFLRNMWWRLGLFVGLTWATTLWTLDRWPKGTAWLALGETIGAIVLAVIFEKRAFCRFVCPVGGVFGLYSMTAPVKLGVKDSNICHEDCSRKNCYDACAWFQFPATVDRNTECNLCLDCVRACPYDNLTLHAQPFGTDLMQHQPRRQSLDEATAIAVVLGIALLQTMVMLNNWPDWQAKLGAWLHLEPGRLLFTLTYVTMGVIAPVLSVALISCLSLSWGDARSDFFRALRTYAYCFLPLGLALHAAHNFHHLFGEGSAMWSGLKRSLGGYLGQAAAAAPEVAAGPSPNTLFIMQWVALLAGLYLAFRVGITLVRRNGFPPQRAFRAALPLIVFATGFTVLNLVVLSAAMGHRH